MNTNYNYHISSDANIINTGNLDYVYDQRLPESLVKINEQDILNDPLISTDSIKLFLDTLNSLLSQFPRINPPTLIPVQTFSVKNDEIQNLISNVSNKKTANAATSTSSDVITAGEKNNMYSV